MDHLRPVEASLKVARPRHVRPHGREQELRLKSIDAAQEAVAAKSVTTRICLFEGPNGVLGQGGESRAHRAVIETQERGKTMQIPVVALVPIVTHDAPEKEGISRRMDGVNRVHRSLEQAFAAARAGQAPPVLSWRERAAQMIAKVTGQKQAALNGIDKINHQVDAQFHKAIDGKIDFRIMRSLGSHEVERVGPSQNGSPEVRGTVTAFLVEAMPGPTFHDAMRDGLASQKDIAYSMASLANYSRELNRSGYHDGDLKPNNLMFEPGQPAQAGQRARPSVLSKIDHGAILSHQHFEASGPISGTLGYTNLKAYGHISPTTAPKDTIKALDSASSHLVAANLMRAITGVPPLSHAMNQADGNARHTADRPAAILAAAVHGDYSPDIRRATNKITHEAGPQAGALVKDVLTRCLSRDIDRVYSPRELSQKLLELGALLPDRPMPYDTHVGFVQD